jgi:hypothetical protein
MQAHKYLTRHAEGEAQSLASGKTIDDVFEFVLVLPSYDEARKDIEHFASHCARNNALLIVVVNQPDGIEHCDNNKATIAWLRHHSYHAASQNMHFCHANGAHVLLVDRTQQRIPISQGVGLARKIGADCAYALIKHGTVKSPWIFSTDADASLPADYFNAAISHAGCSAVIYPFEHMACGDTTIDIATALYELRLHHYVAGLKRAGSPYAFHTLGSTLAIDASRYAAAHGFPKRAGGEDFYLLNKLAKLAPVRSIQQPLLQLRARASHRVPFGTGPAVAKLAGSEDMLQQPMFYYTGSFDLLKCWLAFLEDCSRRIDAGEHIDEWRNWLPVHAGPENSELLSGVIGTNEFEAMLHKAQRQCNGVAALQRYLHTWFDGFRTLKLIHALRDQCFPLQNFRECFGDVDAGDALLAHLVSLNRQLRNSLTIDA